MPTSLRLLPLRHTLDEANIKRCLLQQFDAEVDPVSHGVMLTGLAGYGALKRDAILLDSSRHPYCPVVHVSAGEVTISIAFGDADSWSSSIRFLLWLLESYDCEIRDEYDNDWTERYRVGGFAVFYDARLFAAKAGVAKPALVDTLVLSLQRLPPNYVFVDYDRPELGYMAGIEDEETAAVSLDFDAAVIQTRLLQQFDSLADPCGSSTVLLAGLPTAVVGLRNARVANPQQWPNCPRIDISAATIRIEQQHGDVHQIMSCVRFLVWVMEQIGDDRVCRIEDGNGNDLTAQWSTPAGVATF